MLPSISISQASMAWTKEGMVYSWEYPGTVTERRRNIIKIIKKLFFIG
jgi:hypothetical protein